MKLCHSKKEINVFKNENYKGNKRVEWCDYLIASQNENSLKKLESVIIKINSNIIDGFLVQDA